MNTLEIWSLIFILTFSGWTAFNIVFLNSITINIHPQIKATYWTEITYTIFSFVQLTSMMLGMYSGNRIYSELYGLEDKPITIRNPFSQKGGR